MKRFYDQVSLSEGLVLLDGRPVRTPARAELTVPSPALGAAIVDEWKQQADRIDPRTMPLTGLANAAIDRVASDRKGFAAGLSAYAENDLLCYRAIDPPELAARQDTVWNPILAWAQRHYSVRFTIVAGIMHQPQPPETLRRLSDVLKALPVFALAGLSPLVTISGSLITALAVAEGELTSATAFDAAYLDEIWQAELWGEDELALATRAARLSDFHAASRFLTLLKASD